MDIMAEDGRPDLLVVVGPNGSGKSTVTKMEMLAEMMDGMFVNPDLIAMEYGLNGSPEGSLKAAEMAERIRYNWMLHGYDFGFETVGPVPSNWVSSGRPRAEGTSSGWFS